ncbi:hypothetical protein SISNIDRAFT_452500 [Sistotremastrum niveocremeum HHB9708]|uniref:Homeobox domain-containing protein n=1 Tax=Sistotremastrum niveocremeum HHB9708 TaxID=1314777 RepID=A0A164WM22_9AGAM|nr:hypothetical protein SISNIDRAFT_452500 [Sistotremastrum niveocremeum HHB9708]
MQTSLSSPPTSASSQASTVSSTESTPSPFDGTGRSIHSPEATKEDEKLTYTRRATWPRRRATKAQLDVLESYYKINPKPSKAERVALGDVIGKQPESIRFW